MAPTLLQHRSHPVGLLKHRSLDLTPELLAQRSRVGLRTCIFKFPGDAGAPHWETHFFFFLAALGLRCCVRAFSSCGEQELLFVAVHGLLIAVASLVAEHGL